MTTGVHDAARLDEWRHILDAQDWEALLEESVKGDEVRKGSPFAFALDEAQRLTISREKRRVRSESPVDAPGGPT